ncbi:MAG: sigma-54 dependent transcriptional regulator [Gemmatimonadales bacterium]
MRPADASRILIVDDDRAFRLSTAELLRQDGYMVATAADAGEAGEALASGDFDLILLDLRMPGTDGLNLVEVLRRRGERAPILMISGFGTIDSAVDALQLGADDFLTKPVDPDLLSQKVAELLERRPLPHRTSGRATGGIVGESSAMAAVFEAMSQVAPTETTVLISGETGTGKELVARGLHDASPRAQGPFVPVNCAALAEGILESELFGHVRGAFTGAVQAKRGLFSAADKGTVFLDEVGDMSLRLQQRLLRVLQEREVTPLGGVRAEQVNVRVIAATHRNLKEEVAAGRFRDDLYYRLNVFRIELPPLRERREDIPLLVEAALQRLQGRSSQEVPLSVSPLAFRLLQQHAWPGNVRELFSVVESAAIRVQGNRIEVQHLPPELRGGDAQKESASADRREGRYRTSTDAEDERAAIVAALDESAGVRVKAAELLGMSRTTLWRKMKAYGLDSG